VFQLWFYILDPERLHENRYNIVVFCCIYVISVMTFSLVFQNQMKTMFIQQYYLKSINEEFKELLKHFPEGVMITKTSQTKKYEHREEPMFSKELAGFLYNMKKKFQTEVMFMNSSMREFVQSDDQIENMLGLIDKKMFRVYNFKKSTSDSNATLFSNKASKGDSQNDVDDQMPQDSFLYSLQDLILLNQYKNRLLYFELIMGDVVSAVNLEVPGQEEFGLQKDEARKVVEIKFQTVKFEQKQCLMIKIGSIEGIV